MSEQTVIVIEETNRGFVIRKEVNGGKVCEDGSQLFLWPDAKWRTRLEGGIFDQPKPSPSAHAFYKTKEQAEAMVAAVSNQKSKSTKRFVIVAKEALDEDGGSYTYDTMYEFDNAGDALAKSDELNKYMPNTSFTVKDRQGEKPKKSYEGDRFIVIEQKKPVHYVFSLNALANYTIQGQPLRWEVVDRELPATVDAKGQIIPRTPITDIIARFADRSDAIWLANELNQKSQGQTKADAF